MCTMYFVPVKFVVFEAGLRLYSSNYLPQILLEFFFLFPVILAITYLLASGIALRIRQPPVRKLHLDRSNINPLSVTFVFQLEVFRSSGRQFVVYDGMSLPQDFVGCGFN